MSFQSNTALSFLSSGLLTLNPGSGNFSSILNQGLTLSPAPFVKTLNANEVAPTSTQTAITLATAKTGPTTDAAALAAAAVKIFDAFGNPVSAVTSSTRINIGSGASLTFDPATLQGKIDPVLVTSNLNSLSSAALSGGDTFFNGSDLRLMIEIADPLGPVRWSKQFLECTTLTISIHRVKDPARACGYIGPKGYSRGGRTIAGTIILTESGTDALYEFFSAFAMRDKSKDSQTVKVDQLPPFNISLLFSNEYGYASTRRLLGVDMVTDGTVYSINDAFFERTISFVAADMTPLLPVTLQMIQQPTESQATSREASPMDVMKTPTIKTGPNAGVVYA